MQYNLPDSNGKFGIFGGRFVPETLIPSLLEIEEKYSQYKNDSEFLSELDYYLKNYVGRPTPLYFAEKLSKYLVGPRIYFKREDLNHTGAHKINNAIGQVLFAKKIGKKRIIAETGAGQHGVATATACALLDLECVIYMGAKDMERQSMNVFRMKLLGAKIVRVESGSQSLKDAINETIRDWCENCDDTHYTIGTVAGPHPFPVMVRDFQSVIGKETRGQILKIEGRLPNTIIACIGGGSNAMGIFYDFIEDEEVELLAVEAAGHGINTDKNSASITNGSNAILHGNLSKFLQDKNGQIIEAHSVSAGLDYPGIGPEHAYLHSIKRVKYVSAEDDEAIEAFKLITKIEGIIPALESSHAIAYLVKHNMNFSKDDIVVVNLSGRGDKDMATIAKKSQVNLE